MIRFTWIICASAVFFRYYAGGTSCDSDDEYCYHGEEFNGLCNCPAGWTGPQCQHCEGRFLEDAASGCISDGNYQFKRFIDCSWLIKLNPMLMEPNNTLKITFDEVGVNCDGDTLIVYDGDGEYAPVLAAYSGLANPGKPVLGRVVIASSGMAYLKFSSSSPIDSPGYVLSYRHTSDSFELTPNEEYISKSFKDDWVVYDWENVTAQGRSLAAMAFSGDTLYVYGGYLFGSGKLHEQMLRFPNDTVIDPVRLDFFPKSRYGHTMVSWKDTLIVFGGIILESYTITNELWSFNVTTQEWRQITQEGGDGTAAPPLVGHSSHLVTLSDGRDVMIVIFGYHPEWMYSNFVFEYDISNNTWQRIFTSGAIPFGSYGHASALDASTNRIYVHSGAKFISQSEGDFYLFDVEEKSWKLLKPSPSGQYLHAMGYLDSVLFSTPGRTLGSSVLCDTNGYQYYDISTGLWSGISSSAAPTNIFGQASSVSGNRMFMFGGYDGIMRSELSIYNRSDGNTTGDNCEMLSNRTLCESTVCVWDDGKCKNASCSFTDKECSDFCATKDSCTNCLSTFVPCCSCMYLTSSKACVHHADNSTIPSEYITNVSFCNASETQEKYCSSFFVCHQCNAVDGCAWDRLKGCQAGDNGTECRLSCLSQNNCKNCTEMSGCAWCESTKTCIPSSDDEVLYPFNTCTDWRYKLGTCTGSCSEETSCSSCHDNSKCGWCALDVNTGYGKCIGGTASGPVDEACDAGWYFATCPPCQCNGHSTCDPNSSICNECMNHTSGNLCADCDDGYYGNPENGENCSECQCNDHGLTCDSDGKCNCNVYGMTGDHCESCSNFGSMSGDPINSTCFFEITPGYKYIIRVRSVYVTELNFNSCPNTTTDLAITFVSQTEGTTFNVTMTSYDNYFWPTTSYDESENETIFATYYNVSSIAVKMDKSDFHFGGDPRKCLRFYTTFNTPLEMQVRFVPTFSTLWLLLGTFFSVFFLLLILAIVFWKAHAMWMRYQLRRRIEIEMEEMAARPFGCVDLEYSEDIKPGKKVCLLSEETAFGRLATVGSVLLWMPHSNSNGGKDRNIAIGSALLKSTKYGKERMRKTVSQRQNLSKHPSRGIDNPVLDLQNDTVFMEIHSEQNSEH